MDPATPRGNAARALGLALLLVAALAPENARAEGPPKQDEKEARRLFQSAELSFNVGKFPEALADYQAAYEAKPLPGFLFNIAQCYRNMGDYERARFFFRRYLSLDPRTPNRRRVEALIDEMTRKLAEKPPAAPSAAEPPKTVEPPKAADAPGTGEAPPTDQAPKVADAPVTSPLAAPPPPAATATFIDAPAAPQPDRPVWRRWWLWTAAGVVVAGGAVAAFVLTRPETRAPGTLDPIDGRP
jgi:hypothetical protein